MRPVWILLIVSLISCSEKKSKDSSPLLTAEGGYSDVLIVCSDQLWEEGLKQDFHLVLGGNTKGLVSIEPEFDLLQINEKEFDRLYKTHRYIIRCITGKKQQAGVRFKMNKYAKNQLYLEITGANAEDVTQQVLQYMPTLQFKVRGHRDKTVRKQLWSNVAKQKAKGVSMALGVGVPIPASFDLVEQKGSSYYYGKFSKTLCSYGQKSRCNYQIGWILHEEPYKSDEQFSQEYLLQLSDSLTKQFVRGAKDNQYTKVDTLFVPLLEKKEVNGQFYGLLKSWWTMKNGTMGGPSVCSMTVGPTGDKLIFQNAFFYGPNIKKRDFAVELQNMVSSLKIRNKQ